MRTSDDPVFNNAAVDQQLRSTMSGSSMSINASSSIPTGMDLHHPLPTLAPLNSSATRITIVIVTGGATAGQLLRQSSWSITSRGTLSEMPSSQRESSQGRKPVRQRVSQVFHLFTNEFLSVYKNFEFSKQILKRKRVQITQVEIHRIKNFPKSRTLVGDLSRGKNGVRFLAHSF